MLRWACLLGVAVSFYFASPAAFASQELAKSCVMAVLQAVPTNVATRPNPQDAIWKAAREHNPTLERELEAKLADTLRGSFTDPRDISNGASGPRLYTFSADVKGVGKKPIRHWASDAEAEKAAYEVDKLFHIHLVPVTIIREAENGKLSMQYFYPDAAMARDAKVKPLTDDLSEMHVFDFLIQNYDRKDTNYLVTRDRHIVAIDHGLSLNNGRSARYSPLPPTLDELDYSFFKTETGAALLHRMEETSDQSIRAILNPLMKPVYADQFILRKNTLIERIKRELSKP